MPKKKKESTKAAKKANPVAKLPSSLQTEMRNPIGYEGYRFTHPMEEVRRANYCLRSME